VKIRRNVFWSLDMKRNVFVAALALAFGLALSAQDQGAGLRKAIFADDSSRISALISSKAAVNSTTAEGVTPLMIAAGLGKTAVVKSLIAAGAPVDVQTTKDKLTALFFAADFENLDAARALAEAGASVKATDVNGYSAIDYAIIGHVGLDGTMQNRNTERGKAVILFLNSKGAKPKKDEKGLGVDVGNALGNLMAIGSQADLKELLDKAKAEQPR
jgi:hypothetical protein